MIRTVRILCWMKGSIIGVAIADGAVLAVV
jgi:hypothetical protein